MHFSFEQSLVGRVDDVLDALLDPAFIACLGDLPKLGAPAVLEQRREGDAVVQRVQHSFTGSLSPAVTRVIDPEKLTWISETTYDLAERCGTFRIIPDHYEGRLRCVGTYSFVPGDGVTVRRAEGEVVVSVPLLGRIVERALVSGLEEHLRAEGDLLAEWVEDKD